MKHGWSTSRIHQRQGRMEQRGRRECQGIRSPLPWALHLAADALRKGSRRVHANNDRGDAPPYSMIFSGGGGGMGGGRSRWTPAPPRPRQQRIVRSVFPPQRNWSASPLDDVSGGRCRLPPQRSPMNTTRTRGPLRSALRLLLSPLRRGGGLPKQGRRRRL